MSAQRAARFVDDAYRLTELGWALIRLDGKIPKGKDWQRTEPLRDPHQAAGQWSEWGRRWNMGVVLGPSGLCVLENDTDEAELVLLELLGGIWPETPTARTGSGRRHLYFEVPPNGVAKAARDGLELRLGAHQCVVPPSEHPDTGFEYSWELEPWSTPLLKVPGDALAYFAEASASRAGAASPVPDQIPHGRQHYELVSLAGSMRRRGMNANEIFAALWEVNLNRCEFPGPEENIRQIAESVERYDPATALSTSASQVRPTGDAPSSETPVAGSVGAGASLRPGSKGTKDGTHLQRTARTDALRVVEATTFAAVREASAEPLLGDSENTVLARGGDAAWYGDGGAGKTTLGLDRACHLCAGREWLGLPVPGPVRALWIENEGPRGKFREKLRAKLDAWDGPSLEGRLHVLEHPWSLFTFADEVHRHELVELIRELGIDVVFAGPVQRLGVEGGGTPAQVQAFVGLLALIRGELGRPLAYDLIHHENKSGDVSGAWEGVTDTLVHVQARGHGHTAIVWRKGRWAPELHGRTWKLNWREGERFELDDTPETTDEEIADKLLELVGVQPGGSWNTYDALLVGKGKRKRSVRDQLLGDGRLANAGTQKSMRLFLPSQVDAPDEELPL